MVDAIKKVEIEKMIKIQIMLEKRTTDPRQFKIKWKKFLVETFP